MIPLLVNPVNPFGVRNSLAALQTSTSYYKINTAERRHNCDRVTIRFLLLFGDLMASSPYPDQQGLRGKDGVGSRVNEGVTSSPAGTMMPEGLRSVEVGSTHKGFVSCPHL